MKAIGFEIAGGSIVGRDHVGGKEILLGKNSHDAFIMQGTPDECLIGLVCDGSGSKPHSEVGAKIGANLLATNIRQLYPRFARGIGPDQPLPDEFFERVRQDTLATIRGLALSMTGDASLSKTVENYFYFSTLGFLITKPWTYVFGIGDGTYLVNGVERRLEPEEGNKPPYMSYQLLDNEFSRDKPHLLRFKVHETLRTFDVDSLLIGSDGVGQLIDFQEREIPGMDGKLVGPASQFWTQDKFFKNPDAIRRRLSLINRQQWWSGAKASATCQDRLLEDDTTLVVARRERVIE